MNEGVIVTNTQIPSYSGVTINISNPTVNTSPNQGDCKVITAAQPQAQQQPAAEVSNTVSVPIQNQLPQAYPAEYYTNNYNYNYQPKAPASAVQEDMSSSSGIINDLNERAAKQKELEENGKATRVVALTDEYIKSLENYLNNQNTEIRLMAAKEILTRLDEDKTRFDDAALNALLNKMLQDPQKLIRVAALSAFSSGLASGNDYTVQLLNNIQQNPDSDKEDVVEAANILLKMSAGTEIRYTPKQEQKAEQ